MRIAVQMDHISGLNIESDTTLALCLEAQSRGYKLFQYLPDKITYHEGKLKAIFEEMEVIDKVGDHFKLCEPYSEDLNNFDIILMRQEPPFDMSYITYTHLLEHLDKKVRIINNPVSVRNSPEKLLVTHFYDLMPKTIISRDIDEIILFAKSHDKLVLKPLFGKGGEGIILLDINDDNFLETLKEYLENENEPIMVQEFLPNVKEGDKRIILLNGKPVGCLNRIPAEGEFRSNLGVVGKPVLSELTPSDKEICNRIENKLIDLELYFVGIDVIGEYITEINVTCPTGIRQIKKLGGPDIAKLFWDGLEL